MKLTLEKKTDLINIIEVRIRFSEADSLGIVWHGHFIKYFEDGREAFGREHGLSYLDVYREGYAIPIVKVECDYKRPLKYGDTVLIETTYWECEAAKLIFTYTLRNPITKEVLAVGKTIQVFLSKEGELNLNVPSFMLAWKRKIGLLK